MTQRENAVYDTTIGWRFVNPLMKSQYGVDSMCTMCIGVGQGIALVVERM